MSGTVAATDNQRPRAEDLHKQMDAEMYHRAYKDGMTLSAYLEREDPSEQYKDGLDAFSRQLKVAQVRVQSDHDSGYYADHWEDFHSTPQKRALVPEWMHRQWRRASTGRDVSTFRPGLMLGGSDRVAITSDMLPLGSVMRPYTDAATARYQQLAPAIPLAEMIAVNTPIDTDTYRAFYLTEPTADAKRFVRIGEAADVPEVFLTGGDHTIKLYKYGRALRTTYEALRRQRIDLVALHIARMAIQSEVDKVATALDVIINGDGNAGTSATSYNLTALDPAASPGTLTVRGWLSFKLKFLNPYSLTTFISQEAMALQTQLLNMGSANVPLITIAGASGFGGFRPINPMLADTVAYGITSDAPTSKLVGFDRRFALERVFEVGSNIQEVERYARNQTQVLVMTEVEGYAVFDPFATKILNIAA